ncbi:MAG TPA: (d)CMP kinase [Alphaproteobacteria bacterium]|nr:(d)CMP kinase [Alphaproteobacteria bacterium]
MIIAIDGPAAAGKGTLARRLALALGLAYLDTGALYRAVGLMVLRAGGDPGDEASAVEAAENLDRSILDHPDLRGDAAAGAASKVAAIPAVRQVLLAFQRSFAANPPPGKKGAVLDGRDIGTVVCPDAEVKLFITASAKARAERRLKELQARGIEAIYATVLQDMKERDARDQARAVAPLVPAEDAHILDTTDLDVDEAFEQALAIVDPSTARDRSS